MFVSVSSIDMIMVEYEIYQVCRIHDRPYSTGSPFLETIDLRSAKSV